MAERIPEDDISSLFGNAKPLTRREVYANRLKEYRYYWNARPPDSQEEKVAQEALRLVWPAVRATLPTKEEMDLGVWRRNQIHGPYRGPLPPPVYLNPGEADHGEEMGMPLHIARADGWAIMYDLDEWKRLPHRRFETLIHEALHIVGFQHSKRGPGRRYRRVVSRAKKSLTREVKAELRQLGVIER